MAAPASSIVKSAQNASEIGWAFVPQYYTFVNKDPSRLHCFYTKRSTLIHSTEGEEATPCFGQQEIHEKFMSLNFDDCKVFVSNVDSQSSADGGIIVQVLGEMSNQAGPWRKFAQTFFLAEQPNGFFVLNDIFRYMKEEDDDAEDEPEAEPVTVTEDIAHSETSLNAAAAADPAQSSASTVAVDSSSKPAESSGVAPPPPAQSSVRAPEHKATPEPAPAQSAAPSQVNGFHPEPREAKPPEPSTEPIKAASKPPQTDALPAAPSTDAAVSTPAPAAAASVASSAATPAEPPKAKVEAPAPAVPSTLPTPANANGRPAAPQSKPAAAPAPAPPKPLDPPQPAAPKTWASLAASGKSAWGQGHLSASQGVSSAPSAATQAATEPTPVQSQNRQPGAGPQHPNPASITTGACFIKSVNENIDEKTLKEQLLKKFGPIKELDIVRNKACGFLEFERIDSAKKAIQMSMPFNMGGKGGIPIVLASGEEYVINVESKRQPGERGRPVDAGPKRGFSDRGGRPGANNFGSTGSRGGRGGMDNGPRAAGRGGANTPRGGAAGRNLTNSK
ncbi:hypothetical protein PGTUg99_037089 [Puccinia graminis f. sp. tritici]|uniref:NTF2 domain-containing protein n=1 Tax=Puccinia graminis f. sp. tritici TaxID=56615 RepID=A0A5B0RBD4_PUCGR|nr:hypothetical protein PGTUg99_037089 [Puccinia graminis f. sp. tritici]